VPNPFDRLKTALANRYRVERELGRGGMATVYLAQDLKHERRVAIKVLKPELAAVIGPERFLREIKVTAQLNHPHILPLLDSGDADGLLYYVMPFAEGESLQDRLSRETQLPVKDALRIVREVADALDYAHRHHVVHRDIKPANILLLERHAVVADFGIARAITIAGGDRVTETGLALGTPAYMSPEQGSADPSVDHRTDVYALACVLYEMLAGTPPFVGPNVQAVMARHALDPVPPLRTVRALVPETVEAAIVSALAKSPADRTGTVEEFAQALITEPAAVPPYAGPLEKAPAAIACPACGAESPNTARYCRRCGGALFRRCPECGVDSRASHRYCEGCGTELPEGGLHPGAETARAVAHLPTGERRQLTVMSCNLTASTTLSEELDPEDLRDLVLRHQEDCFQLIRRYEGYLAGQLGSAFLVYFGYPAAHEDDPWRAVSVGLEIVSRAADWATGIGARVAVHTGLVVVGETDAGGTASLVMGTTPDLAVRLQELAPPQTVMVSVDTRRLVEGLFAWETVGPRTFPGLSQPVEISRAVKETGVGDRLGAIEAVAGLTPLAGRDQELAFLLERWNSAAGGAGQVVLLAGDAGIGKSRLVRALKDALAKVPHQRFVCRCSAYHRNSSLYPVIEFLGRGFDLRREDAPAVKLDKLREALGRYDSTFPGMVQLMAELLSVPNGGANPSLELSPHERRRKTLEGIVTLLLDPADRKPVLLVVEDVHWSDPSTLELVALIVDQVPQVPVMVLLTFRPEFLAPWGTRSYQSQLTLRTLAASDIEQMLASLTGGRALPREVTTQILDKTDGVPLFVEELTKMVLGSGMLRPADDRYELTTSLRQLAIPATLRDSLTARLDRLPDDAREVAQVGAAAGRQFTHTLVRAVSPLSDAALQRALTELVSAELVYRRGLSERATYFFKHALIQDAAYDSLLKAKRREYHQRIAQVLTTKFADIAEAQPELVAHHFTEAGRADEAITWWLNAGRRAAQRSAHMEAAAHLSRGLELIRSLPGRADRERQELELTLLLGGSLTAIKGYAAEEVAQAFTGARALAERQGDMSALSQAVSGLYRFHVVRAELRQARSLGEDLLAVAESVGAEGLELEAVRALGSPLFFMGELRKAREHLERGLALYDPAKHHTHKHGFATDPGVACAASLLLPLWLLGYPDQALQQSRQLRSLADSLAHPFSMGHTLAYTAWLHVYRREWEPVRELSTQTLDLARQHGFTIWQGVSTIFLGAALVELGSLAEGTALLRRGNEGIRRAGAALNQPHFMALLAAALMRGAAREEALGLLEEAVEVALKHEDRCWLPELHRLRGEFLLDLGQPTVQAEQCFQEALAIAREQESRALELRALVSLSRLRRQRGGVAETGERLASAYGWFREGFDTPDLLEARELLDALETRTKGAGSPP
jgi:predicted ATPase/class 3 adenylate cyclase/tRNA A-37 threonylcarbamoyl transferase component Bud32